MFSTGPFVPFIHSSATRLVNVYDVLKTSEPV